MAGKSFQTLRAIEARFIFSMKFILARKKGMTQIFTEEGRAIPGTVLSAGPLTVTQVKTVDSDGYSAVQVGFDTQKESRLSKPVRGHLKGKAFKAFKEFRVENAGDFALDAEIKADTFAVGDVVAVSGITKGKGFAGVVKRHGFHGGPRSHGQKHSEREAGSIGGGPGRAGGRVAPGMRMAGRMGSDRVTVKNLKVIAIDAAANEIIVSGAVPGARGSLVEVVSA